MNIFREIPPTAGFPIKTSDIFSLFLPKTKNGNFEDALTNYLGVKYARLTYSGTAAFYIILEALKGLSPKKKVIIPSYICPLLPLAIDRAGLIVEVCDIVEDSFNFNLEQLESLCLRNDVLAIVPVHLAGIPIDFDPLANIAKKYGIFLIEDCAQSLGASYKNNFTGTLGDFSFFSFCRGKGLTIYEGGLIVTKEARCREAVDSKLEELVNDDYFSEAIKILELFGYWIFYRPQLFWFVYRLPQIFWNLQGKKYKALIEYFTEDFPLHKVSRLRQSFGSASFYHLEKEISSQREKAARYIDKLSDIKGVYIIKEHGFSRATYPFLTLVFDDPGKKQKAVSLFENSGLGISQIYAAAIADYDYLKRIVPQKNFFSARNLAQRGITLSTSTFLKNGYLNEIVDKIRSI